MPTAYSSNRILKPLLVSSFIGSCVSCWLGLAVIGGLLADSQPRIVNSIRVTNGMWKQCTELPSQANRYSTAEVRSNYAAVSRSSKGGGNFDASGSAWSCKGSPLNWRCYTMLMRLHVLPFPYSTQLNPVLTPDQIGAYKGFLRTQGRTCHWCGCRLRQGQITLDHITPRSNGGTDHPSNMAPRCAACNCHKDTRPIGHCPFIELEPTDHPLATEQRNGITMDRVREIAEALLHSEAK